MNIIEINVANTVSIVAMGAVGGLILMGLIKLLRGKQTQATASRSVMSNAAAGGMPQAPGT